MELAVRNAELELAPPVAGPRERRSRPRRVAGAALVAATSRGASSATTSRTLGGTLAVASRVAFEDGQAQKNDYRRYRIKEAAAGDDLACMREVLMRRLARIENEPLPDLLVVDGGRGQLSVVSALLGDRGIEADHVGIAKERGRRVALRPREAFGRLEGRTGLPAESGEPR